MNVTELIEILEQYKAEKGGDVEVEIWSRATKSWIPLKPEYMRLNDWPDINSSDNTLQIKWRLNIDEVHAFNKKIR